MQPEHCSQNGRLLLGLDSAGTLLPVLAPCHMLWMSWVAGKIYAAGIVERPYCSILDVGE